MHTININDMDQKTVIVNGTVLNKSYLEYLDEFYEFPVRDGDVWICGIPKSDFLVTLTNQRADVLTRGVAFTPRIIGTTWAQEMVWMIMNNLDTERAKEDIHIRVPFVELTWITPFDENSPEHVRDSMGFIKKEYEKGPVCLKTHLPWIFLPREIQEDLKKPKIIYVVRNPKDTMVSLYHFRKILTGSSDSLEEFCEEYIQDKHTYSPYFRHVLGFWEQRTKPNIMFLRYEEMIKDLPGMIRKVANFLERPISDDNVAKLVNHLSFNNMKKNRAVNNEDLIEKTRKSKGLEKSETNHMRLGKTGSHKIEMTGELISKVDKWIEENTKGTDFVVW